MIYTILSWLYITVLAYPVGLAFHRGLQRFCNNEMTGQLPHFTFTCISGLLAISFISSLMCLFCPLGLVSNLVLLLLSGTMAVIFRRELKASILSDFGRLLSARKITYLLFFLFLLVICYLCFLPSSHHDDGLYYSTSIKWLQEYGTVKGLANLNPRIGFNSSWHILQANFGFDFLNAGLFNDLNGLFYLYVFIYMLGGVSDLLKGDISLASSVRVMFFIPILAFHRTSKSDYIFYNANQMSSSSPDIVVMILLGLIFLMFIENVSRKREEVTFYNLLIVLYSAWLISIKLSAIPVVLLSAFYIVRWLAGGKMKNVIGAITFCIVLLTPWFARNMLVSGWLVFPFSAVDLFNIEWKLPVEHVRWFENAVKVYAISNEMDLNQAFRLSIIEWFPLWFSRLLFIQQIVFILMCLSTIVYIIICLTHLMKRNFSFFKDNFSLLILLATYLSGVIFWLMNGPDFRLGYGFLWPYCIFSIVIFLKYFLEDLFRYIIYALIIYMFSILPANFYKDHLKRMVKAMIQAPISLRMPERVEKRPISKVQTINLVFQDDSWNCPLPAANNHEFATVRPIMIGSSLRDGFKAGDTKK